MEELEKIDNIKENEELIEKTDDDIGDSIITNPFSPKDIKITNAIVLLPSLIRRLDNKEITIPPFQRHADLWTLTQMSRLIESILLKLPLPIFYFDVSNPDKWLIVDGLQRLSTIRKFFIEQSFTLKNLEFLTNFNGKKYENLSREMIRTIEDTQFITYQIEAQTPKKVRYSIFNRINTGGLSLKAQEIRQALNQDGGGVKFLEDVVEDETFKSVVGISNKRMAGQELVLRFMAFQLLGEDNFTTMPKFLDKAMEELDSIKDDNEFANLKKRLIDTLIFSEQILGTGHRFSRSIANPKLNKLVNLSLFDVLTVCFNKIENKEKFISKKSIFVEGLKKLLLDDTPFIDSITKSTSSKRAQETRFEIIRSSIAEILLLLLTITKSTSSK